MYGGISYDKKKIVHIVIRMMLSLFIFSLAGCNKNEESGLPDRSQSELLIEYAITTESYPVNITFDELQIEYFEGHTSVETNIFFLINVDLIKN